VAVVSASFWRAGILPGVLAGVMLAATVGCGPGGGQWLYTLGLYPTETIPAQYTLPEGSIMVLVDDNQDLIQPSFAREALVDEVAKQLTEHKLTDRVTTNEEIARIRQSEPRYDERGTRELGRLAGADTVIWLSTIDFTLRSNLEMVIEPGRFAVMLKVVNAKAEKRDEVRLWPQERDGRLVEVTMNVHDIRRCQNVKEAHQKIAALLADEIAKLFYDQKIRGQ